MLKIKLVKLIWLACVAVILLGCGGDSSHATNIYEGDFSGTWSNVDEGISGTMTLNVNAQGVATGTFYHTQLDQSGTVSGTVTSVGVYTLTATLTSSSVGGSGLVGIDAAGGLVGDASSGFSFALARQ